MNPIFRQVALIGKYHAAVAPPLAASMRAALDDIAEFLTAQGCQVVVERDTAAVAVPISTAGVVPPKFLPVIVSVVPTILSASI